MRRRSRWEHFRQMLLQRREALRRALSEDWQPPAVKSEATGDTADAALEIGVQEMHYHAVEMETRELALIEWALRKLQQGTYGACECCGHKISLARLRALPHARYCIQCQRELEQDGVNGQYDSFNWERVYEMERLQDDVEVDLTDLEADDR